VVVAAAHTDGGEENDRLKSSRGAADWSFDGPLSRAPGEGTWPIADDEGVGVVGKTKALTDPQLQIAEVHRLRLAGASKRQIAAALGIPLTEVKALVRPARPSPAKSVQKPASKSATGELEGTARVLAMADLYNSGAGMREVGDRFGVSAGRVGQLFQKHGIETRSAGQGKRIRSQRKRAYEQAVASQFAAVRDFDVVADLHDLTPEQVKAYVRKRRPDLFAEALGRRRPWGYWTEKQICDAIRAWNAEYGTPPRAADWHPTLARRRGHTDRAEQYQQGRWPDITTVLRKFGSWNAAVEAAGFAPRKAGRSDRPGDDPAVVAQSVDLYRSGLGLVEAAARGGISNGRLRRELMALGESAPQDRMFERLEESIATSLQGRGWTAAVELERCLPNALAQIYPAIHKGASGGRFQLQRDASGLSVRLATLEESASSDGTGR
jgi:hypothetical protein